MALPKVSVPKSSVTVIGVAGGSGSGKTTLVKALAEHLGRERSIVILQDSYYIDRSREFKGDGSLNFDHPDAIDWNLMVKQVADLRAGRSVEVPTYDFATHTRLSRTSYCKSAQYILVDGILILNCADLRPFFDVSIFVDCPEPVRFSRRLKRDVEERGRTPEGVLVQYQETVFPMHQAFVEPSRVFADIIVSGEVDVGQTIASLPLS
jgi:uridine kinase